MKIDLVTDHITATTQTLEDTALDAGSCVDTFLSGGGIWPTVGGANEALAQHSVAFAFTHSGCSAWWRRPGRFGGGDERPDVSHRLPEDLTLLVVELRQSLSIHVASSTRLIVVYDDARIGS